MVSLTVARTLSKANSISISLTSLKPEAMFSTPASDILTPTTSFFNRQDTSPVNTAPALSRSVAAKAYSAPGARAVIGLSILMLAATFFPLSMTTRLICVAVFETYHKS